MSREVFRYASRARPRAPWSAYTQRMNRYLFHVEQPYSWAILRPLQATLRGRGDEVAWFLGGKHVSPDALEDGELHLRTVQEVKDFNPRAVFVPGNVVPDFFPGLKVQVFHGLEWKKKGHFGIRGFFDLYCTHGPITTQRFEELAEQHGYFQVIETGWPKLDPYLNREAAEPTEPPTVVYAPTFSPALTSATALLPEIRKLAAEKRFRFVVKFHPKMDQPTIDAYRDAADESENDNLTVTDTQDLLAVLQRGSVVLSDTSSAITEALLIGIPAVSFRNAQPQPCMIDFDDATELGAHLDKAVEPDESLRAEIDTYIAEVHPWPDGKSSERVLDAVNIALESGVRPKPLNLLRRLKIRRKLGYFRTSLRTTRDDCHRSLSLQANKTI